MLDEKLFFRVFGSDSSEENVTISDCPMETEVGEAIEEEGEAVEITSILSDEDYGRLPPHHRCASHTLNLIASTDSLEAEKLDAAYKRASRHVFSKCQALFNKQNKSSVAADIIKEELGRYLIVPGATRFVIYIFYNIQGV